ncbi:MAG: flagellar hook-length control protein FliK [Azonexus sp.]|jgi:flagellar hook-length control protein FliK|nr:flagellar hook-length control protein FliK [Azonexus sp.]
MIPPDLASNLRGVLPPAPQQQDAAAPVVSAQRITDALSNLMPGQRIMAEIQAMLPNGAFRAMVAQREVTLALPFAAKAGDSLELEVLESNGKMTLAFVANRTTGQQAAGQAGQSVPTTLSQTGRLIGSLIGRADDGAARAAPAPLNGNQPLLKGMPDAAQLAPVLKEALSRSGVFYEAHQARWVAGQLPTDALRQEPQGKMPPTTQPPAAQPEAATTAATTTAAATARNEQAAATQPGAPQQSAQQGAAAQQTQQGNAIPRELTPIVQQQLDALATQNYAWQGQVWQNQKMWWEISQESEQTGGDGDEPERRWQTRLKLDLPALGGIEARLRLQAGGQVDIEIITASGDSEKRLANELPRLREQFAAAGLDLTRLQVQHGEDPG